MVAPVCPSSPPPSSPPPRRHSTHCPPHEQLLARLVVSGVLFGVPSCHLHPLIVPPSSSLAALVLSSAGAPRLPLVSPSTFLSPTPCRCHCHHHFLISLPIPLCLHGCSWWGPGGIVRVISHPSTVTNSLEPGR
ncbi:hypothetical protein L208DRAFT_438148 [Tricholoma matsutake]|nr:hypothetical protein L208DRAFT_438148 [Tricholoma matsutake 945]